jgi:hypothetical protein
VDADPEVGGVLEDLVHGGSGWKGMHPGAPRATRATTGCRLRGTVSCPA